MTLISIHALLAESDTKPITSLHTFCNFYPRSPCGERPFQGGGLHGLCGFLSTLSLRRATGFSGAFGASDKISIHALLAESDVAVVSPISRKMYFYPRSPCGERRIHLCTSVKYNNFYPRSPCGERLLHYLIPRIGTLHFYPRSPCGERHERFKAQVSKFLFLSTLSLRRATIHTAREGSDNEGFLSTLSLRRATSPCCGW